MLGFRGEIGFHNPKSRHEGNRRSVYDIEGQLTGKLVRLDQVLSINSCVYWKANQSHAVEGRTPGYDTVVLECVD